MKAASDCLSPNGAAGTTDPNNQVGRLNIHTEKIKLDVAAPPTGGIGVKCLKWKALPL